MSGKQIKAHRNFILILRGSGRSASGGLAFLSTKYGTADPVAGYASRDVQVSPLLVTVVIKLLKPCLATISL
jgi:hypothetical protein